MKQNKSLISLTKPIIIIIGPTGIGKTALAENLGASLPLTIVNGDMAQLYTPLTIGTAKPDWRNSPLKHYLFDFLHEPRSATAPLYRRWVEDLLPSIWQEGAIPTIVGGSTLYMMSLFFTLNNNFSNSPLPTYSLSDSLSSETSLWDQLHAIDAARAAKIHPNDSYRLTRALQVWHTEGVRPSQRTPIFNPIGSIFIIHMDKELAILKSSLKKRIEQMLQEGWLEEVKSLLNTPWENFWQEKKIIGYEDVAAFISSFPLVSKEALIESITQKTVNYAKKQRTFWRMLNKKISTVPSEEREKHVIDSFLLNLTFCQSDLYINQICQEIQTFIENLHDIR